MAIVVSDDQKGDDGNNNDNTNDDWPLIVLDQRQWFSNCYIIISHIYSFLLKGQIET